ncbi:MAG: hypothetical protein HC817_09815 [Saprospiraceae bacterium]|nr:hypothetical protein [Saprospiraceae bacterium]
MGHNLLKNLLTKNQNRWQIGGAGLGAFIGLTLLLFSAQLYFDLQKILRGSNESDNYVTINKPVSVVNTLFGKSVFSQKDIEELKINGSSIGTEGVGIFTANRFRVSASSRILGFYTELFLSQYPTIFSMCKTLHFVGEKGSRNYR